MKKLGWIGENKQIGSGGRAVECDGSIPPTAVSKNVGNFVHPTFACVFRKTLKAGGPFYLVSMPGEVKDPTQRVNV